MRIPAKFDCMNRTFTVDHNPPSHKKKKPLLGECNSQHGKVWLNVNECKGDKITLEHTFLHELVHVLLDSIGRRELSEDEGFVDAFSGVLHQYMLTNEGEFDETFLNQIPY